MDLSRFCADPSDRPTLAKPFSVGAWSYGTNGRLMIRVPRRADVPEVAAAPNSKVEELFSARPDDGYKAVSEIKIAPSDDDDICEKCDGRGTLHDCPACGCACRECHGTGREPLGKGIYFGFGAGIFNGQYIALIKDLPGLLLGVADGQAPMRFKFDGGEGLIMPMRGDRKNCIEIELADPQPAFIPEQSNKP